MSCSNCSSSSPVSTFSVQYFYNNKCFTCSDDCNGVTYNSKCVFYAGPNLPCSGIVTNDSVELALQKIDEQICSAIGDYSNYQMHCLPAAYGQAITQESQFVDAITSYVCTIRDDFDEFTNTTYTDDQDALDTRFDNIETPGITCATASVEDTDTLNEILAKYCTTLGSLIDAVSIEGVEWSGCLSSSTPTTIAEAFSLVEDQICQVLTTVGSSTLPVFNNTGSCLPSPGAADTLSSTIGKIKTRLCQSPVFDINALTWGCTIQPSVTTTDLQAAFQAVLETTNDYKQNKITFSGDFDVQQTDSGDVCQGITVSLATPIDADRFVASNSLDSTPGTLADKLEEGDNIILDYITTPGKVIISSLGETDGFTVKAAYVDDSPDYLDSKIVGKDGNCGIAIDASYNGTDKTIDITPSLDLVALSNCLFNLWESDPTLFARFCALKNLCASPCSSPSNVQATFLTTTTTIAP